jgi:cyclopropane fatty-acyl-phospholipid synthase-like methyltransferase
MNTLTQQAAATAADRAVDERALSPLVRHQLRVVADAGFVLRAGMRILDLGCGEGNSVRALRAAGYDAVGCDVVVRDLPHTRELAAAGLVRPIGMQPYRLPFGDQEFDLILSSEVLEHVMNYEDFIAENHRVQKQGGLSMHIFPGRYTPIEMHVMVPLASVQRSYPWLLLWAMLGIRNRFQKGRGFREVARLNRDYLRDHTNYPSTPTVRRLFERWFAKVEFREELFLRTSASRRAKLVNRVVGALPFLLPIYRNCWNRVLLARR